MRDLASFLRRSGGAVRTSELLSAGWTERRISAAVRAGDLTRARRGWYVRSDAATAARVAVASGGVLTCAVALAAHGVWAVDDGRIHVRRAPHAAAPRRATANVAVHWRRGSGGGRLVSEPVDALVDYRRCADPVVALAAVDSALRVHPSLTPALHAAGLLAPSTDAICESGIEFIVWHRLLRRLGARRQVSVPGVGRVDFLVGSRLVIEVDGRSFHDSASSFEADRRRDAVLSALGFRVLRFSYDQVLHRFAEVEMAIRAALARQDHH